MASASPRREALLKELFHEFEIIPSCISEDADISEPDRLVTELSRQKADSVYNATAEYGARLVIGADTAVALDGVIFGKPVDREDAVSMLNALSGRTHAVFTGVTVVSGENRISAYEKTSVSIGAIPREILYNYVDGGSPFDKAGGYGIQDLAHLVDIRIDGDRNNVVGLPLTLLKKMLREI